MSTSGLARERCRNHPAREAVARCPVCRRSYCRECVTEHGLRLLCAECLGRARPKPPLPAFAGAAVARVAASLLGLLVAWSLFYATGRVLAEMPSDFMDEPEEAGAPAGGSP